MKSKSFHAPRPNIYERMYTKLEKLLGELDKLPDAGKSESKGYMDLHFDKLFVDPDGRTVIALAHYFRMNGDSVPDPDMQIRIDHKLKTVEALTYQDLTRYSEVYPKPGLIDAAARSHMNDFLSLWLTNLIEQGHRIVPR